MSVARTNGAAFGETISFDGYTKLIALLVFLWGGMNGCDKVSVCCERLMQVTPNRNLYFCTDAVVTVD